MLANDKLERAYKLIVSGQIDHTFSVVEFLTYASQRIEHDAELKEKYPHIVFFRNFVIHNSVNQRSALDLLERFCLFIQRDGASLYHDFNLPQLRKELGVLVDAKVHEGPIADQRSMEAMGWLLFYSLLLAEAEMKMVGDPRPIDVWPDGYLKRKLPSLKKIYGKAFIHCALVRHDALVGDGPPFCFVSYLMCMESNGFGGFTSTQPGRRITPDGFIYVPYINTV